jgi:NYN domain
LFRPFCEARVARAIVLIDGSNIIGALGRAGLGYPALKPLLDLVVRNDDLAFARFYGHPPPTEPWAGRWKSFMSANRHVAGLDWFQGYRQKHTLEEKAVDVAIITDLFDAYIRRNAEKAILIGGDGDHLYGLRVAKRYLPIHVYVIDTQPTKLLARLKIGFTVLSVEDILSAGICNSPVGARVPGSFAAPHGHRWSTPIFTGPAASLSMPPSIPVIKTRPHRD